MDNRIHREIIGGHLLVIGGAEDKYNERRILRKFLHLAGDEKAEVLIVPVASDFPEFAADVYVQAFRNLGVANPRVLRATSRQDVFAANPDELLDGITGVFITGGDQMRLVSILRHNLDERAGFKILFIQRFEKYFRRLKIIFTAGFYFLGLILYP